MWQQLAEGHWRSETAYASSESSASLGIRNSDADIYVPVTTALLRFKNRG